MSDVIVEPADKSNFPDTGDATKFGPNWWNAPRKFVGGVNGQIPIADAASATGARWGSVPAPDLSGVVPTTRTVNGHALSADVIVTKGDLGLGSVENTALSTWAQGAKNVKFYGAVGDGTTNDYAAITAAITVAGVGGRVYFPAGTYLVGTALAPLANQTWVGDGMQATFLKQHSTLVSQAIVAVVGTAGVTLRDLGFLGYAPIPMPAIATSAAPDCVFERLWNDANCQRLVIVAVASHRCRVRHCHCAGTAGSNGIELNGSDYCVAEFNTIVRNGSGLANGIEIYQQPAGVPILGTRVIGNHIDGATLSGIDSFGDWQSVIVGNTIVNTTITGVTFGPGEIDPTVLSLHGIFDGNTIRNCGGTTDHGLLVAGSNWTITGNSIEGSGNAGIAVSGHTNTLVANVAALNRRDGIDVSGNRNLLVGNSAIDNSLVGANTGDGFDVYGSDNTLSGNQAIDTRGTPLQRFGLFFQASSANNLSVNTKLVGNLTPVLDSGTGNAHGYVVTNNTLATAGTPVQAAPDLRLRSHVWNTTTPADNAQDWIWRSAPVSGAVPSGTLNLVSVLNGVSSTPFNFTSAGAFGALGSLSGSAVNATGVITAGSHVAAGATASHFWTGRSQLSSPANGQVNIANIANNAGVGLDVATDAILKIRTRAQTGDASVTALNLTASSAVINRTKAGTPVDGDVTSPADGMMVVDTTASKIWVRIGGVWKGVAVT